MSQYGQKLPLAINIQTSVYSINTHFKYLLSKLDCSIYFPFQINSQKQVLHLIDISTLSLTISLSLILLPFLSFHMGLCWCRHVYVLIMINTRITNSQQPFMLFTGNLSFWHYTVFKFEFNLTLEKSKLQTQF